MKKVEQLYDEAIVKIEDDEIYPAIYNRVRELEQQKAELLNILDSISEERIFCYDSMDRNTDLEQSVKDVLNKYKESE